MEYGVFVSKIIDLPADPRSVCSDAWRHLLPPAPLRALYFGTEFCIDLLPDTVASERFCHQSREAGLEAVLLTPVVTQNGLSQIDQLLHVLVFSGCVPTVVFNDWGVFALLRDCYPNLRRRAGRLMNRGLRDPRLVETNVVSSQELGKSTERMFSMLVRLGVEAVETDPDLEGNFFGEKSMGLQRVLHFPYVFAATGRNCLIKADGASSTEDCFTKGLGMSCPGHCRGRWQRVARTDTERPLWRSGNTIFYEASPAVLQTYVARSDRIVLYERPTA